MKDDITVRQMKEVIGMATGIMENAMQLTMHILEGECEAGHDHFNLDEHETDALEMDAFELEAFLVYEEATLSMFKLMRKGLIQAGYTEVNETSLADLDMRDRNLGGGT